MTKPAFEIKVGDSILFEASKDVRKDVQLSEDFYSTVMAIGRFSPEIKEIFFLSKENEIYIVKDDENVTLGKL